MAKELGLIGNLVKDVADAKVRATLKGAEIAKLGPKPRKNVKYSGADFDIEVVSMNAIDGGVEVFARAWTPGGAQIGFGADGSVDIERFRIFNPLIEVPDGTFSPAIDGRGNAYLEENLKEDPLGAVLNDVCHTIKVKKEKFGPERIVAGKIGRTTSTFNPVAGQNSPVDGRSQTSGHDAVFTTVRAAAGTLGGPSLTDNQGPLLFASTTSNQFAELYRGAICFDTADIGDTDTISSAVLSLQGFNSFALVTGLGAFEYDIVQVTLASTADIVNADFAAANWGTTVFASIASGSITEEGAYVDFTLDSNGIANVNKTGVSQFGTRLNWDTDNSFGGAWSSSAGSYWITRSADHGSTPPKLVVEHAAPSAANTQNLLLMGVG